jgi:hypothetical protein
MAEQTRAAPGGSSLTGINDDAPVAGASEIDVVAAPEAVWDVLTAIDRWPS